MAQVANIVINDGKTTPVAHTFTPTSTPESGATFHERLAAGVAIGYPMISLTVKPARDFNGVNRVHLNLSVPQLEVISGSDGGFTPAPKVAYSDTAKLEMMLPGRSTAANRKDLRVLMINLLANAQVIDSIENLATPF